MRTETITRKLYKFGELSDEAKENALDYCREWQVDDDWWDFTYEDAERIGLKITSFDLGGSLLIEGDLTDTVGNVCRAILLNHGPKCDTYHTAQAYYQRKHDGCPMDDDEFRRLLLEDYLSILRDEYEYLTSDESIAEMIESNEYEFDEKGDIA